MKRVWPFAVNVFAVIGFVTTLTYAWSLWSFRSAHTRYVFPDGYRGICRLIPGQLGGALPSVVDDVHVIQFPKDGVLRLQPSWPPAPCEVPEFTYASGPRISMVHSVRELQPGVVGAVFCGDFSDGTTLLFVGSKEDAEKVPWSQYR